MLIQQFDTRIISCQNRHACEAWQVGGGCPLTLLAAQGRAPVAESCRLEQVMLLELGQLLEAPLALVAAVRCGGRSRLRLIWHKLVWLLLLLADYTAHVDFGPWRWVEEICSVFLNRRVRLLFDQSLQLF